VGRRPTEPPSPFSPLSIPPSWFSALPTIALFDESFVLHHAWRRCSAPTSKSSSSDEDESSLNCPSLSSFTIVPLRRATVLSTTADRGKRRRTTTEREPNYSPPRMPRRPQHWPLGPRARRGGTSCRGCPFFSWRHHRSHPPQSPPAQRRRRSPNHQNACRTQLLAQRFVLPPKLK